MNIPESAIQPFGVLGFPKLNLASPYDVYDTIVSINRTLEKMFKMIEDYIRQDLDGVFSLGLMIGYIKRCLSDVGAEVYEVEIDGPISDPAGGMILVTVFYKIRGDSNIRDTRRILRSKNGFC